jgi:hypothetical protein
MHSIIALLLPLLITTSAAAQSGDTVYVESTDVMLYLHPEARLRDYLLLRLESVDEATSAISFISQASASGDANDPATIRLLLGLIDKCSYRKDNCLVFLSPRTHDLFVDRPYILPKRGEMVFPVSRYPKRVDQGYAYIRVMIVPKSERSMKALVREFDRTIIPTVVRGAPSE